MTTKSAEIRKVGFVGLGTMGAGMVANLLRAGFEVRAFNRSPLPNFFSQWDRLEVVNSVAEAFVADAAILCLADDEAIESLVFREDKNPLAQIPPGFLLLDCGTTSPEMTMRMFNALVSRSASFLDAPVTGSKNGAENGSLTFMVGGEVDEFNRARSLFSAMGEYVVHVGERCGLGQAAKYCLNMQQAVLLQGTIEAYGLARQLDVPVEKMVEIIEHSAGRNGVGSFKTPSILRSDFNPHFKLALMHKDLGFALSQARRVEFEVPAANAVSKVFDRAMEQQGWPEMDFSIIAQLINGLLDDSRGG